MDFKTQKIYDSIDTPIIICDKERNVTFKNISAKRSIPKPSVGAKIDRYISKRSAYIEEKSNNTFYMIENDHSSYKKALVFDINGYDHWLFIPALQYADPEDMQSLSVELANEVLNESKSFLCGLKELPCTPHGKGRFDKTIFNLQSSIKFANLFTTNGHYETHAVLDTVKYNTEKILRASNKKCDFEIIKAPPESQSCLNFVKYAIVYSQIIGFALKFSCGKNVSVLCAPFEKTLMSAITISTRSNKLQKGMDIPFENLANIFKDEYLNIMFTWRMLLVYGATATVDITDDATDNFTIKFEFPLKDKAKYLVMAPISPFFKSLEMQRYEDIFTSILETRIED